MRINVQIEHTGIIVVELRTRGLVRQGVRFGILERLG